MHAAVSSQEIFTRNNVAVRGQGGAPMLFAHGFGCDQGMWRFVTPAFEADHRVVLLDYVGAGKSDPKAYNRQRYSSLDGYAQDIIDVCDALALKDVIFVGHSVSSMIGLLAAIRRPELFRALVLVAPSPRYINDLPGYVAGFEEHDIRELLATMDQNCIGWANFLAPQVMQNPDRPELGAELTASFCSIDPVIARQFAKVTFLSDNRADLPKVRVPSLLLQCSDDLIAPRVVGDYLRDHLPQSELWQLRATGHCPHLSAPDEVSAAIRDYLRRHAAAHAPGVAPR